MSIGPGRLLAHRKVTSVGVSKHTLPTALLSLLCPPSRITTSASNPWDPVLEDILHFFFSHPRSHR